MNLSETNHNSPAPRLLPPLPPAFHSTMTDLSQFQNQSLRLFLKSNMWVKNIHFPKDIHLEQYHNYHYIYGYVFSVFPNKFPEVWLCLFKFSNEQSLYFILGMAA